MSLLPRPPRLQRVYIVRSVLAVATTTMLAWFVFAAGIGLALAKVFAGFFFWFFILVIVLGLVASALVQLMTFMGALAACRDGVETTGIVLETETNLRSRMGVSYRLLLNLGLRQPKPQAVQAYSRVPGIATNEGTGVRVLVSPRRPRFPVVVGQDLYPFALSAPEAERASRWLIERGLVRHPTTDLNKQAIRKSLGVLWGAVARQRLPAVPSSPPEIEAFDPMDPLVSAQRLAAAILRRFALPSTTVVVSFNSTLEAAAQVELGAGDDFFIEVHSRCQQDPERLVVVLAHEIAHIFLHRAKLQGDDGYETEILTDVAAVLWGFGAVMVESSCYTQGLEKRQNLTFLVTFSDSVGYLTPTEIVYVMAKQAMAAGTPLVLRGDYRFSHRQALRKARQEAFSPPLERSSWLSRWRYRRARRTGFVDQTKSYSFDSGSVVFHCTRCCQEVRVPTERRLEATCPNCKARVACIT